MGGGGRNPENGGEEELVGKTHAGKTEGKSRGGNLVNHIFSSGRKIKISQQKTKKKGERKIFVKREEKGKGQRIPPILTGKRKEIKKNAEKKRKTPKAAKEKVSKTSSRVKGPRKVSGKHRSQGECKKEKRKPREKESTFVNPRTRKSRGSRKGKGMAETINARKSRKKSSR